MLKKLGFAGVFLFISFGLFAQNDTLRGTIPGLNGSDVYLVKSFAGDQKIVDTAQVNMMGTFSFSMKNRPVGMYQVMTGTGLSVRLIYDHKPVDFKTGGFQQGAKVEIIHSPENRILYQYLNIAQANERKVKLLKPVVQYYPRSDPFYQKVKAKAEKLQNEVQQTADQLVAEYPHTLAAQYIRLDQPVAVPLTLTEDQQNARLKRDYFNNVDFSDTLLLHTDWLTKKLVGYLALYQQPGMSKKDVEQAFLPAVDTLMSKSIVNEKMYLFTLHYLINGFDQFGFQKLLLHIARNSKLEKFSGNSLKLNAMQQRVYDIIHLAPGQPAPDFKARTMKGNEINLYQVKADRTLLIFWASWCPHCTATLPGLEKYYNPKDTKKLQIIAVSVDTKRKAVEKAIKDEGYQWPVIAQLKGWDSPIALNYGVSATPTFFLLDQNKQIIVKTTDVKILDQYLNQ